MFARIQGLALCMDMIAPGIGLIQAPKQSLELTRVGGGSLNNKKDVEEQETESICISLPRQRAIEQKGPPQPCRQLPRHAQLRCAGSCAVGRRVPSTPPMLFQIPGTLDTYVPYLPEH